MSRTASTAERCGICGRFTAMDQVVLDREVGAVCAKHSDAGITTREAGKRTLRLLKPLGRSLNTDSASETKGE